MGFELLLIVEQKTYYIVETWNKGLIFVEYQNNIQCIKLKDKLN